MDIPLRWSRADSGMQLGASITNVRCCFVSYCSAGFPAAAAGQLAGEGEVEGSETRDRGRAAPVVQCSGTVMKPIFWMPAARAADMISASFW